MRADGAADRVDESEVFRGIPQSVEVSDYENMSRLVMHRRILVTALLVNVTTAACQQQIGAASQPSGERAATGTLVATGTMGTARAAHTATTLRDGRVLLVGGFTVSEGSLAGAELYDPASRTFSSAGPMRTNRQSHTATLLPDGTVLIAGGYDAAATYLASAERFDPKSGSFTDAGVMRNARAGHVAVSLPDGRVLLAGGVGTGWTFLASAEVYDPALGTFSPTGSMKTPRESHTAVRLSDGRVLVAGGHQGRGSNIELYASAEIYNSSSGTFSSAGDMTVRRHKHDAVLLSDGRVLITGGTDERDHGGRYQSAELFDPATGKWLRTGSMLLPRYKHAGTSLLLPNGPVIILGGNTQAEIYDPLTATFGLVKGDARMPGQFSAAALLNGGRALVTGGYGERGGPQANAWLYQP